VGVLAVTEASLIPEPVVRNRKTRCYVCKGDRRPERSRRYGGIVAEQDPFCSTECAKSYYGYVIPLGTQGKRIS
jgi:uncharacterized Fe-S cluster-containing radical SAM superfamily protein